MRPPLAIVALGLLLVPVGCGSGSSTSTHAAKPLGSMSAAEVAQLGEPRITAPNGPPPRRLVSRDLRKGWGLTAKLTDEVTVEYVGADYRTGATRWRSRGGLGPLRLLLSNYDIVQGLEPGIRGMKVGGRRELIVPPQPAAGKGARIFVVDLLAVDPQTGATIAPGASDGQKAPDEPAYNVPSRPAPRRLVVKELRQGSGPALEVPAEATVRYIGIDYATGMAFFNAWGPNRPSHISLADPDSVWARGLRGMQVGGQRQLTIPAKLGYGSGALIYAVELMSIDRQRSG